MLKKQIKFLYMHIVNTWNEKMTLNIAIFRSWKNKKINYFFIVTFVLNNFF
jgi:hypothetical protein